MPQNLRLTQVFNDHKTEAVFIFGASVKYIMKPARRSAGNSLLHLEGMEQIEVREFARDIAAGFAGFIDAETYDPDFPQDGSPVYINLDRVRMIAPKSDHALVYFADNTKLKIKPHAEFARE